MHSVLKNNFLIVHGTNRKLRYDFSHSALHFFRERSYPIPEEAQAIEDAKLSPNAVDTAGYPFKTVSWAHQVGGMGFALKWKRAILVHGMGCGKSKTLLDTIGFLIWKGLIRHSLIVCPKAVLETVWPTQFEGHAAFGKLLLIHDTKKAKRDLEQLNDTSDPTIVVVNYDKISVLQKELHDVHFGLIAADEAQKLKNSRALRSKSLAQLSTGVEYCIPMTGTPVSRTLVDIFGIYKVMDPFWLGNSEWFFRNRYCQMGGWMQHQITGYKNEPELRKIIDTPCHVVLKRDALPDLPPKLYSERVFELSPDEKRIYKETKRKFLVEIQDGRINVANAASRIVKLQEIANGFVVTEAGEISRFGETKLNGLMEAMEEAGEERITVWCRFREDIASIGHKMAHVAPERPFLAFHGDTKDREAVLNAYRASTNAVLAIQTQSGGMGLDLTCSHVVFRYSRLFSWMDEEQAEDRHHRPGQTCTSSYTTFIMEDTVDRKIQHVLSSRKTLSEWVIESKGNLADLFNEI